MVLAVSSDVCLLISVQITMAPRSANLYDIKRPMPLPAPEMKTTWKKNDIAHEIRFYHFPETQDKDIRYLCGVAYLKERSKLRNMIIQANKNMFKVNNEGRVANLYIVNKSDTQGLKHHLRKYVTHY